MSWFVLNPPPGIRMVSFFITARFASQDDRGAFIENVLEQLATLLDESMPAYLTESTREAHLLGMLSDAAGACLARGERLALIVDGLDEDRGVTTGSHAYSIAALLPDPPPADMRIIVAGRPNPPIPADVPGHHQLRDPAIVRPLAASPYGAVVRNDMEGELKRLLLGSEAEQDLLGLVAAARGGLSGSDLAELTGRPVWQVNDELGTVTGRSFSSRPSRWLPGVRPDVYVLGHEELQDTASSYLGSARLGAYRQRLHAWTDRYRDQGWPDGTPEYMLRGYYRMLMATGDLERMIACATDRHRHDRMLEISGGDDAALQEIIAAQDAIVVNTEPDLNAMARLAVLRDYLAERNSTIPVELPAAWASLGRTKRAEALAGSIIHPGRRALSQLELVKALMARGELRDAKLIAQLITNSGRRNEAAMVFLRAAALAGNVDSAETFLQSISSRSEQTVALAVLAQAAAEANNHARARDFASRAEAGLSSTNHRRRGEALATLAQAAAVMGDETRARAEITQTELLVRSIEQPSWQAAVWAALVKAASAVESPARVEQLLSEAETQTRSIVDTASRTGALASLARAASAVGDDIRAKSLIGDAEILVRSIRTPARRAAVWATILRTATVIQIELASHLVSEAEESARSIADRESRATAMAVLARALTGAGEVERARLLASEAESLTRSVVDPDKRGRDLTALAKATAAVGILDQAEAIARSISSSRPRYRVEALTSVAKAVAASGNLDRAKAIAQSMANAGQQAGVMAALAKDMAAIGNLDQSEMLARSITSPAQKAEALIGLAKGFAVTGNLEQAEIVADSIRPARQRSSAFAALAETAITLGDPRCAAEFAEKAETFARLIAGSDRAVALVGVVKAVAVAGDVRRAEEIARSIDVPGQQGAARAALVRAIAAAGEVRKASVTALAIEDEYWRAIAQITVVEALATTDLDMERAYGLAQEILANIDSIYHPNQQEAVLVGLVRVTGTIGHPDDAEKMIAKIATPGRQAEALIALSETVGARRAATLMARATRVGHWTISLNALVKAQPQILQTIVNEVGDVAQ